ncbi:hypothetical protein LY90DRAFT_674226 [Neocallimastix californiae]|uniref:Beige protein homolog 1 n=1 Tax=Neocallimastix californiae TaxID=1754190 RepID=A0A1Y2AZF7_9FUNG|nr:hypothetical protein LY90DRAFT_674226 [Neocallimastix californiae]|eukprot:ORY27951.1 hypothetical protein LY90DRAFT_674226 [Neocallimastix californiae]
MKSMKWINRLIPTNETIIDKIDLNCVKFCKCEGEPQRLSKSLKNLRDIFKHSFSVKNEINKKSFSYYVQYFCELYDSYEMTSKNILESIDDLKGFFTSLHQHLSKQLSQFSNEELLNYLQIPENYYILKAIEIISKVESITDQTNELSLIFELVNTLQSINSIGLEYHSNKENQKINESSTTLNETIPEENANTLQEQMDNNNNNNRDIKDTAAIDESERDPENPMSQSSIYSIIHYEGSLDITKFLMLKSIKVVYEVDDVDTIIYCDYKRIEEENSSKIICTCLNEIPIQMILKSISNIINRKIVKESILNKIIQTDSLKTITELLYIFPMENYSLENKLFINDYLNSILLTFICIPNFNKKQLQTYFKDTILPLLINISENTNNTIYICSYNIIIESLKKSSISVIDEYYKLNGLSLLRNVLFNNVEDEKIRSICITSLKELLVIGDESILEDISYQESPYQLLTFEFPSIPKNLIDVIKSKEVLKEYLDIIININNDIVVHDLVVHLYYLIKLIKCNYFILEKYNVFLTLINNIENFNQKTINNIMETLYFVMEVYDYLPLKELMCIGIYLQGTLNPKITKSVCDLLLKLLNSSSRYKDSFNDIGFITIIGNAFHDLACTLNYNITMNDDEKGKLIASCITPTFKNKHRSITAEKILTSSNIETFFKNFHSITECLIELISENENNMILFRSTQQNALNQLVLEDDIREDVLNIYHAIISYCFSKTQKSNIDNPFDSEEGISPEYLKLIELLQLRQYPPEFKIDILYEINELNIENDYAKNIFREAGGYICILSLISELGGIWSNKPTLLSPTKSKHNSGLTTPVAKREVSNDHLSISSIIEYINGSNQLDTVTDYIKSSFVMKKMKIKPDETTNTEVDNHISSFVLFQFILTVFIVSLKNMPLNRRFFSMNFNKTSFSDLLYMTGIFGTEAGIIIYGYLFALLAEDLSIIEIFSSPDQKLSSIQDTEEGDDDNENENVKLTYVKCKSDFFDNFNDKSSQKTIKDKNSLFRYYKFPTTSYANRNSSSSPENIEKLSKIKFINAYGIPIILNILQNSMNPNTTLTILEIIRVLLNSYKYNQIMAYKTKSLLSFLLHLLYSSDDKSKYPLKLYKYLINSENKVKITDSEVLSQWDKCFDNIYSLAKNVIEVGIDDSDSLFLLEKYNEISIECNDYLEEYQCENEELQKVKTSLLDLMYHALKVKHNYSYIHFDLTLEKNSYISLKRMAEGLFPTNSGYTVILNFKICQFKTKKTLNILNVVDIRTNNSILTISVACDNNSLRKLYIKTNKVLSCVENLNLMENKWYEIIIVHQPNKYLRTLSFNRSLLNVYVNGELYDNNKNEYIDAPISTQYLKCAIGKVVDATDTKSETSKDHIKWDFGVCNLINYSLDPSLIQKIFKSPVSIQIIKFPEDKNLICICSKNIVDNFSEIKDEEGKNNFYRIILNNTKSLNGIRYSDLSSIYDKNVSQFGIIKGVYTEYNPNLFSNSVWKFGGMSILLKIMENENRNKNDFNTSLNIVMEALQSNNKNSSDMEKDHKYEIFANILKNNKQFITNETVETLFKMVKTPEDGFLNSIIKKFALALREEVFARELIPKVIEIIIICLKHHFTKNQLKVLASYISSTLPKVYGIENKIENRGVNVNSFDDISVKSNSSYFPKIRNKPRSFTINSSFPSLSIDTSFSRLKKRKPSKVDLDLIYKANGANGNEYYQNKDDPSLYSHYARNKLLEALYNVLCEPSDNNINYAFEFSKLIDIQWYSYFINKNVSPVTLILIMRIVAKLLQTQNYQYKLTFKNTFKMYKLMNYNITKFYRVSQLYHSLLALTFEAPINTIPINSPFDVNTLKKLYKNIVQSSSNTNIQYNTDSLLTFLKMIKEMIRVNIENISKNQDRLDYNQFNNINNRNTGKQNTPLLDSQSPIQNILIQNINNSNKKNNNLLMQQPTGLSSEPHFLLTPSTPKTPQTPKTPYTPLIDFSNENKLKRENFNLTEDESFLYIYQDTDDYNEILTSSIKFIENIFSFFLHLFSLNNKKIKLLFSDNSIINELLDIIHTIVNNQLSMLDIPYVNSPTKKLPVYNLIIAMATSSIAEDWKPLYALNSILNVLSNYSSDFKNFMSINIYKHVINKLLLISNISIDMLIDPKIINNLIKFLNNATDFIYQNKSVRLAKNIMKLIYNVISKIREMNNDKYNSSLTNLYKSWNRIILYFFFEERSQEDIDYIINSGINVQSTLFNDYNDQEFFNCLLLNIYNEITMNENNIESNLIQAWNTIINGRLPEFRKIIKLKSDDKIADDEIRLLSDSTNLTVEFKDYINENRTALNELFSNYISYSWKAFKNQEQNRINERGKNTSYNSDKLISPKGNENSEEKEEITSLQFRILERLKMIQDRTIISAKRLLIDKMETSKVLEIEWSKIIYNLYREKAIWEKASDEIKYWKLDFTEATDRTRQKLRLNLNFNKELLKLNAENESDTSSVYSIERKHSNSSNPDNSKFRNNFVKNKTEVADYSEKSMETQKRIKEKNRIASLKRTYDNSFINIPQTPAIGNKQNYDELVSLHKNESPKYISKEISEDASINNEVNEEEDNASLLNDLNVIDENAIDDDINETNDNNDEDSNYKEPLTTTSEISNITSEVSPTSPGEKNAIDNINERISRLIDQNEDKKIELYNTARIKGLDICEGLFILGESNIYFIENYLKRAENEIDNISNIPIEERNPFYIVLISSTEQDVLKNSKTEQYTYDYIKWSQSNIVDIKKRRFIFRNVGIEFFLTNGRSYLFTFENKERDTVYNKLYYKISSNVNNKDALLENDDDTTSSFGIKISNLLSDYYSIDKIRKKWEKRKISNFEYLFTLNTFAGRSYNDLTQYPIFPWILSNYESSKIDLNDPSNFRDLSKPMGAQDEERALKIKERYDHWEDPEGKPAFHYGTHYSSAMIVCTYLMRLEPFTDQYLKLQGGNFDHADRLFFSIDRTWKSAAKENTTDVRELIPEFFYLPAFFINSNGFDFGMKHDKTRIDNVALPTWASLESEYVSSNLHKWIDLIFGYKQQGEEAVNALNVFYHLSYEGAVDIDKIKDPIERVSTINIIHNFGQTPSQLFKEPHPPRQEKTNEIQFLLSTHYDYLVQSSFPLRSIDAPVGEINYINDSKYFILKKYQTMIPNNLKYVEWNFMDKCIRVCNYENSKVLYASDILHTSDITCLKFADQDTMITGGSDMVICVWKASFGKYIKFTLQTILRGHKSPITCLQVSRKHSIILSSSANENYVIIWDLNRYIFVHSLPIKEQLITCEISDIWGNIILCCSSLIYIYSINGELLAQQTINIPVISCAVYDCTEIGNTMTTIITGHKNGLIKIWNYSYHISEKTQSVKWDISLCRIIETNMSSITAITIPSSHRFILAGDNKGVTYPWIMLDGSGTTLHYNGSEDACRACNNKFAVFDRFKIRCVGCGYFYCNECTFGIQQFEKDNKICKFCFKKICDIDNKENEENKPTSSLSLSEELIIEPSIPDSYRNSETQDNVSNSIDNATNNENENEVTKNEPNMNETLGNEIENENDNIRMEAPIINIIQEKSQHELQQ